MERFWRTLRGGFLDQTGSLGLLHDRVIERAMTLLEAADRYRLLLHDPRALDDPPPGGNIF